MEDKSDILFSRAIKAGHRIYYIDVKQNWRDDMYLCVTESKKMNRGTIDNPQVSYEKHKIFLYREDFEKFQDALSEAIGFVTKEKGSAEARPQDDGGIHIDLEF